ncbi:MAG: hypothetical protein B7Y44_06315 [Sphingomonadales bacterium 28-55-16]|nr:MAG: hypothetical protein B7Y44_06315 [Sphingomonadales bacterium 28-55-16]
MLRVFHFVPMSNSNRRGKVDRTVSANVSIMSRRYCCFIFMKLTGARVRLVVGVAMMASV